MADLAVEVVQRFGRYTILPANPSLFPASGILTEAVRIAEVLARAITLFVLVTEQLACVSNTVSKILDQASVGELAFVASEDHAVVTNYTAQIRVSGNSTVVATQDLGKPTPDGNHVIISDLTSTFAGLSAGNYTVSILTTSPGGSADSTESAEFVLPLP